MKMRPCHVTGRKPGFYLKLIQLVLSLLGLIVIVQWKDLFQFYYFSYSLEVLTVLITAGHFYILSVFLLVYIFDETHHVLELLFLGPGVVLHLLVIVFFVFGYVESPEKNEVESGNAAVFFCMTSATCMLFMCVDFLRQVKLGSLDNDYFGY